MSQDIAIRLGVTGAQQSQAAISGVEARLDRLSGTIRRTSQFALGLGVAFGADLGSRLAGFGRSAVEAADAMTNMQSRLVLVTGSAQAAAAAQKELFRVAQESRVSFVDLAETYTRLARAVAPLGISQERVLAVTQSIGQAMALSGGSAQSLQAALNQLGQGFASGVVRGEELNSVLEQAPRLAQAMADGLGVTVGQLRALGAEGRLTTARLVEALEKAGPGLARELAGSSQTVSQSLTQARNSTVRFVGDLDRATGASSALAQAISSAARSLDSLGAVVRENEPAFKLLATALGGLAAGGAIAAAVSVLGRVAAAVGAIGAALAANPAVAVLLGVAAAGGAAVSVVSRQRDFLESTEGKIQQLARLQAQLDRNVQLGRGEARVGSLGSLNDGLRAQITRLRADIRAATEDARRAELSDRTGSYAGQFPDAKSIDETRSLARLDLDVRRKWADDAIELTRSFRQRISLATDPGERDRLEAELQARLRAGNAAAAKAAQDAADAQAAPARAAADAQRQLDLQLIENRLADQREGLTRLNEVNEALRAAGLRELQAYADEKSRIEQAILAAEAELIEQRIALAAQGGKGDQAARLQREQRLAALRGELGLVRSRQAAAARAPDDEFDRAVQASEAAVRRENVERLVQQRGQAMAYVQDLLEANRDAGAAMLQDDRARTTAQIALDRDRMLRMIEPLRDLPAEYAKAYDAVNAAISIRTQQLVEQTRPSWVQMARDWASSARSMEQAGMSAMSGIERAIDELVTTGKINFRGLLASFLADLAKIQLRQAAGGSLLTLLGLTKNANGNVYAPGGLQRFAAGGVVSRPTLFGFAGGMGLMGEAGPEAIMPLRRGRDGRLGVAAEGGAGVSIVQHINVAAGASRNDVTAAAIAAKNAAVAEIQDMMRRGRMAAA